jgi:hypothetical protein
MKGFYLFIYLLFMGNLMKLSVSYTKQRWITDKWWKKELERVWKEAAMPETEISSMFVYVLWGTKEFHEKLQSR